jgi:hypothetical protein
VPKLILLFFMDFLFQNSSFVGFETRQTQGLLWGWGHLLRRRRHEGLLPPEELQQKSTWKQYSGKSTRQLADAADTPGWTGGSASADPIRAIGQKR